MIGTQRYREWKEGRDIPPDGPVIPDHALGYSMDIMLDIWDPHERIDAYGLQWIWRTFIGRTFYPELIERYHILLEFEWDKIQPKDKYQKPQHLQQMLDQLDRDTTMSETKKHRWLGYIQGVLASNGLLTVEEERNFTRDIFNGA